MNEKNELPKIKNEYPDVFKNIPDDITAVVLSDETALKITDICLANGVQDEVKIEKISYLTTLTLLGDLPMEELSAAIEKEAHTSPDIAKKLYDAIHMNIFRRIENSLKNLYKKALKENPVQPQQIINEPKMSPGNDSYREKIE